MPEVDCIFSRKWAMPNSRTFQIKPIKEFIDRYIKEYKDAVIIDPFANHNKIATITNDLDPTYDTTFHMEATDFLRSFTDNSIDVVLYDPPYSARQVSECYRKFEKTVNKATTQSSYWANQKKEIARILRPGGLCISFGWESNGIGKKLGFELVEIMLVAHGGHHNDTLVVAEKKKESRT